MEKRSSFSDWQSYTDYISKTVSPFTRYDIKNGFRIQGVDFLLYQEGNSWTVSVMDKKKIFRKFIYGDINNALDAAMAFLLKEKILT